MLMGDLSSYQALQSFFLLIIPSGSLYVYLALVNFVNIQKQLPTIATMYSGCAQHIKRQKLVQHLYVNVKGSR